MMARLQAKNFREELVLALRDMEQYHAGPRTPVSLIREILVGVQPRKYCREWQLVCGVGDVQGDGEKWLWLR